MLPLLLMLAVAPCGAVAVDIFLREFLEGDGCRSLDLAPRLVARRSAKGSMPSFKSLRNCFARSRASARLKYGSQPIPNS